MGRDFTSSPHSPCSFAGINRALVGLEYPILGRSIVDEDFSILCWEKKYAVFWEGKRSTARV
jgi:hypothetical protein